MLKIDILSIRCTSIISHLLTISKQFIPFHENILYGFISKRYVLQHVSMAHFSQDYANIKKVLSISLVTFNIGHGCDD